MAKPTPADNPIIVITNLSKRYGKVQRLALDGISLQVNAGEVYGFLGPNGAGKSTTIRLLMNFLQPSSGQATILGQDIVKEAVSIKKSVGYLAGDFAVYSRMTGLQYLQYMHDIQPAEPTYVAELADRLKADLAKRLGALSRGNRQKIGIIQAFMHKPKVLILDEPTSGLDPLMQEVFYELVKEAKERGAAVFISSHILSEVQKICDRVGIIREGKLVEERSIKEMTKLASQTLDLTFAGKVPLASLKKVKGLEVISSTDSNVSVQMHGKLAPLFGLLAKHEVTHIDARHLDLEELFLTYYEDKGAGR